MRSCLHRTFPYPLRSLSHSLHFWSTFTDLSNLLHHRNPNDFLKKNTHPNIDASALIRLAVHIIPLIPPKLFGLCAVHPWKPLSTIENLPDPFEALSDKHTKWCSKGNHYVPKSEFARSTTSLDGLQEACQKCLR